MRKPATKKAAAKAGGKSKAKPAAAPVEQLHLPPAGVLTIALDRIDPSPYNPRRVIEPAELKGLAASIKENGLLQPLVVRLMPNDRYELIAGHRRLAAMQSIGVLEAPCLVRSIDSAATVRALQIIENLQRADIEPMDEARAFVALQDEDPERWTAKAIGQAIGKSDRFVAQRTALARNLLPALQAKVADGSLKVEVARTLATAPQKLQKKIGDNPWNLREADSVRSRLQQFGVPLSLAAFKVEDYIGEFLEDEEGGKRRWFADTAQFDRLQKKVAEARADKLRKTWPNVEVVGTAAVRNYVWADDGNYISTGMYGSSKAEAKKTAKGLDKDDVTALLFLDQHKIKTVKGVVLRDTWAAKVGETEGRFSGSGGAWPGVRSAPVLTDTDLEHEKEADAFNAALAERLQGLPALSYRLLVYAFIEGAIDDGDTVKVTEALEPWREQLAKIVDFDDPYDHYESHTVAGVDPLWHLLGEVADGTINEMLGRLAASTMRIDRYSRSTGVQRALASVLGIDMPAWVEPQADHVPHEPDEAADPAASAETEEPVAEAA